MSVRALIAPFYLLAKYSRYRVQREIKNSPSRKFFFARMPKITKGMCARIKLRGFAYSTPRQNVPLFKKCWWSSPKQSFYAKGVTRTGQKMQRKTLRMLCVFAALRALLLLLLSPCLNTLSRSSRARRAECESSRRCAWLCVDGS